jgi:hypothetical protein
LHQLWETVRRSHGLPDTPGDTAESVFFSPQVIKYGDQIESNQGMPNPTPY